MKTCNKCNQTKPLTEFHKDKNTKDGFRQQCKECVNEYYQKNKECISTRHKEYRQNNKESIAEYKKEYYQINKKRKIKYNNQYTKLRLQTDELFKAKEIGRAHV